MKDDPNGDGFFTRDPETLALYTVYRRPRDYPEHYVIRRSNVNKGVLRPLGVRLTKTLQEARDLLAPYGLTRLPRQEEDDSVIVEVWL